ncbi:hypothetical protein [Lutibacter maritimus]|uniref:PKD domain-containing protein n=1 Tax=Lutibacter maritimus TaxID=593133 RepID=A0A1I6PPB3_9FLAO|nr:hypothetical protein [Lutibacter maritimus]SFS42047.1 hypothetical protein SAMN04488006_1240 [Lutibacter maritimus]
MKKIKLVTSLLFFAVLSFGIFTACQPDDVELGNGIVGEALDASFTVTPVEGAVNKYLVKALSSNYITSKWDLGTGEAAFIGKMEEEIYFPDAGTYAVKHYAVGIGGESFVAEQNVVVTTSDPAANLIQGGLFANAEDHAKWTVLTISSGDFWKFNDGSVSVTTGGNWSQQAIYQAVQVEAGQKYKIDMNVSSTQGLTDTWFEVYASTTVPVQGADYATGTVVRSINTWAGCGLAPFNGLISTVGCGNNDGIITFPSSGTVYLVIKCGSGGTPTITIKDVQFRKK